MFTFRNTIVAITFFLIPSFVWAASQEHEINGYYHSTKGDSCTMLYEKDGTFMGVCTLKNKTEWKFRGKWWIQDNMLAYKYTRSSIPEIPVGTTGQDKILAIGSNFFLIKRVNGELEHYTRARK